MKRNMSNMNNIMMKLFTVIMLMMFSVGVNAQVKVDIEKFTGGKIGEKGQTKPDGDNMVTITLIVTPDNGYIISKKDITVVSTVNPSSARGTRALEINGPLELEGDDPKDLSAERTYRVKVNANFGVWVKEANFQKNINPRKDPDYSGYYYIAGMGNAAAVDNKNTGEDYTYSESTPATNYYLVPASEPAQNNWNDAYFDGTAGSKPFLTTFKTGQVNEVIWQLEKVTDDDGTFYYVKHYSTGKYVIYEPFFTGDKSRRKCMHLDDTSTKESGKFLVGKDNNVYYFVPKSLRNNANTTHKFWNIADKNRNSRHGLDGNYYYGGLIGLYSYSSNKLDVNSKFSFENAQCATPEITYDNTTGKVTITSTEGATIYYTTDGVTDPDPENSEEYDSNNKPTILSTTTIQTIAKKTNMVDSEVATITIVVNPTITLTIPEGGYIYDGEAKEPEVASVKFGSTPETTISTTGYEVSYSDNTNAGTATVTISDIAGDDYFVYGSITFTIAPATLHEVTLSDEPLNYNGESQSVSITSVTAGDGTLVVPSDDYTVSGNEGTIVGDYTITVTAKENTNYTGSVTNTFTISPKSLGNGITPTEGITIDDITRTNDTYSNPGIYFNGTALTEGGENHYTVTTSGGATSKYYIVTFTGANNFTGSVESKFVNVDFYHNDAATCWASSFVINSGEGAFAIPDGYSAHIVTGIDGTTVTAPSLTYVPEGVPVILLADTSSDADAKGFAAKPISGDAPDTSGNMLKFVTEDSEGYDSGNESMHFDTGEIYLLYNGEFVLNKEGDLAKGKVYLDPNAPGAGSTPAPARLAFLGNPYTDIESVSSVMKEQETDEKWYSLDGRRLDGRPTKKGLYLINRKKVVIN